MLHLALLLLPPPWQCLSSGPGMEGAIAVENDSSPLNLLILDFLPLHPADPDGPGAKSVHVAGHTVPCSTFLYTWMSGGSGNGIMEEFIHEILIGLGQW